MTADLQWRIDRPVSDRLRFDAVSYPQFRHGPAEQVVGLQDHLELPPGYNPRTLALAQELRRELEMRVVAAMARGGMVGQPSEKARLKELTGSRRPGPQRRR